MQIDCNLVLDHPKLNIVHITARSFCSSRLWELSWPAHMLWLVTLEWYLPEAGKYRRGLAEAVSSLPSGQSVCIFINQSEEAEAASEISGARVAFVNHNVFISPRLFSIRPSDKIYDAVVTASPLPFKRVHLCEKVENLCCIRRIVEPATPDLFDAATLHPRFLNHRALSKREVCELLNRSYCGVILSACEGACFASTEYLFCGLPVVSTPSVGGRHVWYDESNSILVEPDADAVRDAVAELKGRIRDGTLSPAAIRENALALRNRFASEAEAVIADVVGELGLADEVLAGDVMRVWLAEIDIASRPFKFFSSVESVRAYFRAGNLAFWRLAVKRSAEEAG